MINGGMEMKNLYITRKLPEQFVDQLRPYYNISEWTQEVTVPPTSFTLAQIEDADAIWSNVADTISKEIIDAAPNLKMVSNLAVGYNNIDAAYLKEKGIILTNTPNVLNNATADLAFALLMATARRLPQNIEAIRRNEWGSWSVGFGLGMDIAEKTLGIIGMGKIGQTLAKRATGFDMNILYHNRSRNVEAEQLYGATYCDLSTLLQQADYVVIFTPLTEETRNLITLNELKQMKRSAILINAARGGIVNEADLYTALKEKIIWAAGSDVFETEPITANHPLLTLDNFVGLPHIGSATIETRQAMMQCNVDSLIAGAKGEPIPYIVR